MKILITITLMVFAMASAARSAEEFEPFLGYGRLVALADDAITFRSIDMSNGTMSTPITVKLSGSVPFVGCAKEDIRDGAHFSYLYDVLDNGRPTTILQLQFESCFPKATIFGTVVAVADNAVTITVETFDTPVSYGEQVTIKLSETPTVLSCDGRVLTLDDVRAGRKVYANGDITEPGVLVAEGLTFSDNCSYTTVQTFIVREKRDDTTMIAEDIFGEIATLTVPLVINTSYKDILPISDCFGNEKTYEDIQPGDTISAYISVIPDVSTTVSQINILNGCPNGGGILNGRLFINGFYLEHNDETITLLTGMGRIVVSAYDTDLPIVDCNNQLVTLATLRVNDALQVFQRENESGARVATSVRLLSNCTPTMSLNGTIEAATETSLTIQLVESQSIATIPINSATTIIDCAGRERAATDPGLIGGSVYATVTIPDNKPVLRQAIVNVNCPTVSSLAVTITTINADTLTGRIAENGDVLTVVRPQFTTVADSEGNIIDWTSLEVGDQACLLTSTVDAELVALCVIRGSNCFEDEEKPESIRMVVEGTVVENADGMLGVRNGESIVDIKTTDRTVSDVPVVALEVGTRIRVTSSNRTQVFQPVADMVEVIADAPTSVDEEPTDALTIAPVPARDAVTARGNVVRMDLYSTDGRAVVGTTGSRLNLAEVTAGMYILRVAYVNGSVETFLLPVL